jgi:hypothetical protein
MNTDFHSALIIAPFAFFCGNAIPSLLDSLVAGFIESAS